MATGNFNHDVFSLLRHYITGGGDGFGGSGHDGGSTPPASTIPDTHGSYQARIKELEEENKELRRRVKWLTDKLQ